ncbi:MAG: XRE family transcriptional regulator [Haliscomenobacteraceae bacterium CHB4]|nr:hypothetical protein [Saprospiraceae bacterium]MCE7924470.1 XRE family transcriptional regulator [Haliscomenobacteraceae bacterium CHB4]
MEKQPLKVYTLDQIKDEMIGAKGTPQRDNYEFELNLELLGEMIKTARQERNLTQEQLGQLIGVQKAQISKLERNASNVTIETVLRVFNALQAKVHFQVQMLDTDLEMA